MKILHLTESVGWSGGAAQLLELSKNLREKGHDCVLACPPHGELAQRARDKGLRTIPFQPFQDYDLLSAWRLARVLDEEKADILHAHHSRSHAVGLIAKFLSRSKPAFIVTRRVSFPIHKNPFSQIKYVNSHVDSYIAVSQAIREILAVAGVPKEKIEVIPSGVDPKLFFPKTPNKELLKNLKIPENRPVIGKISNYGSWKGQDVFLKAAAEVIKQGISASFLLAGRDTDSPDLKNKAKEIGLPQDSVFFLGFRRDVPEILSCLSLSVNSATEGEGLSGALRESLAMSIPAIASDTGGNRELVIPGETGELFPPGDHQALAGKMIGLLKDPGRAKSLAEKGRKLVLEKFTVEKSVEKTIQLYEKLLK